MSISEVAFLSGFILLATYIGMYMIIPNGRFGSWENSKFSRFPEISEEKDFYPKIRKTVSSTMKSILTGHLVRNKAGFNFSRQEISEEICDPVLSVVFPRIHKTGSTTLRIILGAHLRRNKAVSSFSRSVLVYPDPFIGGFPGSFKRRFAWYQGSDISQRKKGITMQSPSTSPPIQILVGHIRFDPDEIKALMDPKARYVTMMRDPYSQFESSFYYYYGRYEGKRQDWKPISCHSEPYLQIAKGYGKTYPEYLKMAENSINQSLAWYFRSMNPQSYDLGLDPTNQDVEYILEKAKELDAIFDLVAITEYYMESLILLKDVLCLSWKDVILGRHTKNSGSYKRHVPTNEEKTILQTLNKQDFILYDYFNKSFWRKVDTYGRGRMEREKEILLRYRDKTKTKMTKAKKVVIPSDHINESFWQIVNAYGRGGAERDKDILLRYAEEPKAKNTTSKNQIRSGPNIDGEIRAKILSGEVLPDVLRQSRINEIDWRIRKANKRLNPTVVSELAAYMHDNQGWCTF